MSSESKLHWEKIYAEKADSDVSWYQEIPQTSLRLIIELDNDTIRPIIDIGGGNSNLTTELLKCGYKDLTVLDISGKSLLRTKHKLGYRAKEITWIEADVLDLEETKKYQIWHDRAVFHFLTDPELQNQYKSKLMKLLRDDGLFILSTFSVSGPKKCSGLEVCQYDEKSLQSIFGENFVLIDIFYEDHKTPTGGIQNFVISVWKKRN